MVTTPIQSLRYLQGYALGDGWIYPRLDRFKIFVYDVSFAAKVRLLQAQIEGELGLRVSESTRRDRHTGTMEWRFEIGGSLAVEKLSLHLLRTPEGLYFLAGLWDADGNWSPPDESHSLGQARIFGGGHKVTILKRLMKLRWGFVTGRKYIATHEGHVSSIGTHVIITRTNVYGTGILARSMAAWVTEVGSKMILKKRDVSANRSPR